MIFIKLEKIVKKIKARVGEVKNYLEQSNLILKILNEMVEGDYFYFINKGECSDFKFKQIVKNINLDNLNRIYLKSEEDILLKVIVELSMIIWGRKANLNFINVSQIENFSGVFSGENKLFLYNDFFNFVKANSKINEDAIKTLIDFNKREKEITVDKRLFNGFIDEWDTSNGIYFMSMFRNSYFNQHELKFNLENAMFVDYMFANSHYNHDFMVKGELKHLKCATYLFKHAAIQKKIEIDLSHCESIVGAFYKNENISKDFTLEQIENVNFGEKGFKSMARFISREFFEKFVDDFEKGNLKSNSKLLKFLLCLKSKDVENFLSFKSQLTYNGKIENLHLLKKWLILLKLNNMKNTYVEINYLNYLNIAISIYHEIEKEPAYNKEVLVNLNDQIIDYLKWYESYSDKKALLNKKKLFAERNKVFLEEKGLLDYFTLQKSKLNKNKKSQSIII